MKRTKQQLQIVGSLSSIAVGETARIYRFPALKEMRVIRTYPLGIAAVFSCYVRTVRGSDILRACIRTPYCSQTQDYEVTERWSRIEISLKNEISLQPLDVILSSRVSLRQYSDIALAFPQTEEGLFATSPIPPDVQLPVESAGPDERGAHRAADQIWLDKEKTGLEIDSNSAAVMLVGEPVPRADQILKNSFLSFFSFWSSDAQTEVSVGISGKHDARFVVRVRKSGEASSFVESDIIGGHQLYFVCAIFDRNKLSVVINGAIAIVTELNQTLLFDRVYLGSSHLAPDAFNGHIKRYAQWAVPLLYPRILEIYCDACPANTMHTYAYMLHYFRYSLTTDSEFATANACLSDDGFSYFISQIDFAVPQIYEQFAPGAAFVEENVRDWVMALMRRPGASAARESYSKIGRTDLALNYRSGVSTDGVSERTYRIELKIWGRSGYDHAPSQPLKYMMEGELVGVFIMLDRRKNPSIEDFESVVKNNSEYPCLSVREIPILNSDLRYFVSFHSDPRYRMARMMINIHLPIQDAV